MLNASGQRSSVVYRRTLDKDTITALAPFVTVIATILTAVTALYPVLATGESAKARRAIRFYIFALLFAVLAIVSFVIWRADDDGTAGGTTAVATTGSSTGQTTGGTTTNSLETYRKRVGGVCDRRRTLEEERQIAESQGDDRALVAVLKQSDAPLKTFKALEPPADLAAGHQGVSETWDRWAANLDALINAILAAPAARAMDVALNSRAAKVEREQYERLKEELNNLVGSECPVMGR